MTIASFESVASSGGDFVERVVVNKTDQAVVGC